MYMYVYILIIALFQLAMLAYPDNPPSIGRVLLLELSCLESLSPRRNSIINIGTSTTATLTLLENKIWPKVQRVRHSPLSGVHRGKMQRGNGRWGRGREKARVQHSTCSVTGLESIFKMQQRTSCWPLGKLSLGPTRSLHFPTFPAHFSPSADQLSRSLPGRLIFSRTMHFLLVTSLDKWNMCVGHGHCG